MVAISPSILTADFGNLSVCLDNLARAGLQYVHLDVMDGDFVPNLTFGWKLIADLRRYSQLIFDVHLMVNEPERYIEDFAKAGADIITIHAEATKHPQRALQLIKNCQKQAGISLVPSTDTGILPYVQDVLDLVLIMTVNPGFGGQKFLPTQLAKIKQTREILDGLSHRVLLEVDGGINAETASEVIQAGADILVAGSYIFSPAYAMASNAVEFLRQRVTELQGGM